MDLYPVLISHNSSSSEAWGMRLQENNVDAFLNFVAGLESNVGSTGSITHLVFDGENRMDFGDVAILNLHTHELVGVCPADKFSAVWHVVYPESPIAMPVGPGSTPKVEKLKGYSKPQFVLFDEMNLFGRDRVKIGTADFEEVVKFRMEVFNTAAKHTSDDDSFEDLIDNCVMLEDYLLTGDLAEADRD